MVTMAISAIIPTMASRYNSLIFWKKQFWRKIGQHLTEFPGGAENQVKSQQSWFNKIRSDIQL